MKNQGQETTNQLRDRSQGCEDVNPFSKMNDYLNNARSLLTTKRLFVL